MLKHLAYLVESLKHLYSVTCCRHSIIVVMVVSLAFRCTVSMSRVHRHMAVLFINHVVLVTPWRLSSSISSASLVTFQPVSVKPFLPARKALPSVCLRFSISNLFACVCGMCTCVCNTSMQMSRNLTQSLETCIVLPLIFDFVAWSLLISMLRFFRSLALQHFIWRKKRKKQLTEWIKNTKNVPLNLFEFETRNLNENPSFQCCSYRTIVEWI